MNNAHAMTDQEFEEFKMDLIGAMTDEQLLEFTLRELPPANTREDLIPVAKLIIDRYYQRYHSILPLLKKGEVVTTAVPPLFMKGKKRL